MRKTPLKSMVPPSLMSAMEPGCICAENVSVIFILETYTHSIAKKYKVSQPKAILHLTKDGFNGLAEKESMVYKTKAIFFN